MALDAAMAESPTAMDDLAEEAARRALEKDCHLLQAAVNLDRVVVSLDRTARRLAEKAAARCRELRAVVWVDPTEADSVQAWLEGGARLTDRRRLGDA